MKNKLIALLLALLMALPMAACGETAQTYTPGVYTSVQRGHNNVVVIETEFSDSAITRVDVVQHSETPGLCEKPIAEIPAAIVENQSLAVDTVAGATILSEAILAGVADCATQAGGNAEALYQKAVAPKELNGEDEEITTDVVVVGGGAAGSAAALNALQAGAKVVLLEKTATPIGAGTAAGSMFANGSSLQKADGNEVTSEWIYNQYMETSNYQANGALVSNIVRHSGEMVDWLIDNGVRLTNLPAGMQSGSLEMEQNNQATANAYVDGGIAAIRNLHERIASNGGEVRYETPAYEILMQDGKAAGVLARKADGGTLKVNAKSVIIATGGFTNNSEMLAEYFPRNNFGRNSVVGGAEGDGLNMLWAVGAGKTNVVAQCYGIQPKTEMGFIDPLRMALTSPNLFVNNQGVRIINELAFNEATSASNVLRAVPNEELYCIFDTALLDTLAQSGIRGLMPELGTNYADVDKTYVEVGWPSNSLENIAMISTPMDLTDHVEDLVSKGYIVKADSIDELAQKLGMPKLSATVSRYNELCHNGVDEDFFKDAEYMDAVEKGPFYAASFEYVNFIGTMGGALVDETLQACQQNGTPIPNLWAAGLDAGGMYGNSYVFFEGGTLGFAYTSGYLAGEYAAGNAQK